MNKHLAYALCVSAIAACSGDRVVLSPGPTDTTLTTRYSALRSSSAPALTARLQLGAVHAVASEGGSVLRATGLSTEVESDSLAQQGVLLAFPAGQTPRLSFSAKAGPSVHMPDLARRKESCRCGSDAEPATVRAIEQDLIPAAPAELQKLSTHYGISLYRLRLAPLAFTARDHQLSSFGEIEATVSIDGNPSLQAPEKVPESWYRWLRSVAANGESLGPTNLDPRRPERLYVIAADGLIPALGPWIEWKVQNGILPIIFAASQVGSNPTEIRDFLRSEFKHSSAAPTHLLLVGDHHSIAPFYERVDADPRRLAATDYPYSLLDSDEYPDVFYGRLLASTPEQVTAQTEKWIRYEREVNSDTSWRQAASVVASREGTRPTDEEYATSILDVLRRFSYTSLDLFLERTQTAGTTQILEALGQGRSWLTYFGHGNGTEWVNTAGRFGVRDLQRIAPHQQHPIVIDVSCRNAAFTLYPKCLGQAWVERADAGAVAYYGSAVDTAWHEPAVMAQGITKGHFEQQLRTLGPAVLAGQMYLLEKQGMNGRSLGNLKSYVLLGDPTLHTQTGTPEPYRLTSQANCSERFCRLSFQARGLDQTPMENIRIAVATPKSDEPQAVLRTGANGNAEIEIPHGLQSAPWLVTASAPGKETYRSTLSTVEPSELKP